MAESESKNKICVVGWTDYDNDYFDDCELTDEVFDAVVEEVRSKGYLFGGDSHQESYACCPVMSNGCCARFSTRGWGEVIAVAHNVMRSDGKPDYMCGYMDSMIRSKAIRRPKKRRVDFSKITVTGKTYDIDLPDSQYENAYMKRFEARVYSDDLADIKVGDFLSLTVNDTLGIPCEIDNFKVKEIVRGNSFEELIKAAEQSCYFSDPQYFGYDNLNTDEELLEQLYREYPREEVQKHGVILFRIINYLGE